MGKNETQTTIFSSFIHYIRNRVRKAERSEPSLQVSEFHLVQSGVSDGNAVRLQDLAKTLGKRSAHGNISKKLAATEKKSKTLPKPLEKPAAARVRDISKSSFLRGSQKIESSM